MQGKDAVEKYYSTLENEDQIKLKELENLILSISNDLDIGFSYGVPIILYKGMLMGISAHKKHISMHIMSKKIMAEMKEEIDKFSHTISSIHLPKDKKYPSTLIKKIVRQRMKDIDAKINKK